jgi:hypothetical protein
MPTALWCGKFYFVSGAHRVWEGRGATWKKRPAVKFLLKFAQVCPSLPKFARHKTTVPDSS